MLKELFEMSALCMCPSAVACRGTNCSHAVGVGPRASRHGTAASRRDGRRRMSERGHGCGQA